MDAYTIYRLRNKSVFLIFLCLLLTLFAFRLQAQNDVIVLWSTEIQPDRVAITQGIVDAFMMETGLTVDLQPVDEDILPALMRANLQNGNLPDLVFHPLEFAMPWYQQGILDVTIPTRIITEFGESNFGALNLVRAPEGGYISIPTDGWGQLMIYRTDLFDQAGLQPPRTFNDIEVAARTLHDPNNEFYGIALPSDPSTIVTQQVFEHFALANGVMMFDGSGNIVLNTAQMEEVVTFYAHLARDYGLPGVQDVASTRNAYLNGQVAMTVWSPFILDEMAGLSPDVLPACPQCADDITYIARNSGFVTALAGQLGNEPSQYGQITSLGITVTAHPEAEQLARYLLTTGYIDWLSTAPEGKFPMYRGSNTTPTANIEAWSRLLNQSADGMALADAYTAPIVQTIITSALRFQRWGLERGYGELVGELYFTLPIPFYLNEVIEGRMTAGEATLQIQFEVEDMRQMLDEETP